MAPRRASSSAHPLWFIIALILMGGLACGGYRVFSQLNDPFRTLTPFPVQSYLENSNALRGNVYRIDATVANQLRWSPSVGRLYSVEIDGSGDPVAVLIPMKFNSINIQKGQRFAFEIEVGEKGILRTRSLRKV